MELAWNNVSYLVATMEKALSVSYTQGHSIYENIPGLLTVSFKLTKDLENVSVGITEEGERNKFVILLLRIPIVRMVLHILCMEKGWDENRC